MTWYAIKDGTRVLRCVEQATAPSETHAVIAPWVGIPPGGAPGRELREAEGALYWFNVDPTSAWAGVRAKRDDLLAASDWVSVRAFEQGQAVPALWATYRQALRDITAQPDPFSITWPAAPG